MHSSTELVPSSVAPMYAATSSCPGIEYQKDGPFPKMSSLSGLPPELILCVADHLPLVDLICFSLCNHRHLQLLEKHAKKLERTGEEKMSFLNRLERDHPRYFPCDICDILHEYDGSETYAMSGVQRGSICPRPCSQQPFSAWQPFMIAHRLPCYLANNIYFTQVKLAMRRFQYGPGFGISTESLNYTQICEYAKTSNEPEMTSLFSRQAQICPESPSLGLCIRMQDILLVNKKEDLIKMPTYKGILHSAELRPPWILQMCSHIRVGEFRYQIISIFGKRKTPGKKNCFFYRCELCNTECGIKIRKFGNKIALIVTKWVGLGFGITRDLTWSHQASICGLYTKTQFKESPFQHFEEKTPESFGRATSRNLSYLKDQQYRKDTRFDSHDLEGLPIWCKTFKEASNTTENGL